MKKTKRGSYWKNITPFERTIRMAYVVKKRWNKTTKKQRKEYSLMMYKAKMKKKHSLSTGKKLTQKT